MNRNYPKLKIYLYEQNKGYETYKSLMNNINQVLFHSNDSNFQRWDHTLEFDEYDTLRTFFYHKDFQDRHPFVPVYLLEVVYFRDDLYVLYRKNPLVEDMAPLDIADYLLCFARVIRKALPGEQKETTLTLLSF